MVYLQVGYACTFLFVPFYLLKILINNVLKNKICLGQQILCK